MLVEPLTSILISGVLLGLFSPIVASRRLIFLTLGLTHIVLLAVASSVIVTSTLRLSELWNVALTFLITWSLTMAVWILINLGVDEDVATGIVIGLSAAFSVLAMYAALTLARESYSLWSYILGDPLLTTWNDVFFQLIVATAILLILSRFYFKLIYVGLDREYANALGLNAKLLDALLLTLITLGTVAMLRTVGAILLHVMYVLPGATAFQLASKVKDTPLASLGIAVFGGLAGYFVAIATDLAPSGAIGVVMCFMYITSMLTRLRKSRRTNAG